MRIKIILLSLGLINISCQRLNKVEQYLACYAINLSSKQECVGRLVKKYIAKIKDKIGSMLNHFNMSMKNWGLKSL